MFSWSYKPETWLCEYRLARRILLVLCVGALTGLAALSAGEIARGQAERGLMAEAADSAKLHASVLRSELERYRLVPVVLAEDAQMIGLLEDPSNAASLREANLKLERLTTQTRAAAIYLLDNTGLAIASSNWQLATSFVGSDYSFRPYFKGAITGGDAEFFALGTISGRPGLFLSRKILSQEGRPLGVAVVKVEFDALEADWRQSGKPAYISDPNGVVLITSVPQWRFLTVAPLTPLQRKRVQIGQTLGPDSLGALPFRSGGDGSSSLVSVATGDGPPQNWMTVETATSTQGWTLHLLMPAGDVILTAVANARAVAALITLLLTGALAFLWQRHRRAEAQARIEENSRAVLELRIDERTSELRHANEALNAQIEERRRAEEGREILRDELIQANKLATLGQIAAGVAHEINQPVAAIRMHADTAQAHLDRNDGDSARRTLDRISDLTGRIGVITEELRAFSRKSASTPSSISPEAAIDGALLLLAGRLRQSDLVIVRAPVDPALRVFADPLRLEQVVVNLIQNSVEAMEGLPDGMARIDISVRQAAARVEIIISDTGPGLSPEVAEALFTPFLTTKQKGLGLGLVICRDIIAAIGGELLLRPAGKGATFVIGLKAG